MIFLLLSGFFDSCFCFLFHERQVIIFDNFSVFLFEVLGEVSKVAKKVKLRVAIWVDDVGIEHEFD